MKLRQQIENLSYHFLKLRWLDFSDWRENLMGWVGLSDPDKLDVTSMILEAPKTDIPDYLIKVARTGLDTYRSEGDENNLQVAVLSVWQAAELTNDPAGWSERFRSSCRCFVATGDDEPAQQTLDELETVLSLTNSRINHSGN